MRRRKTAILVALGVVAGCTLATMAATTLTPFAALRLLTGMGLGGLILNTVALVAEAAPKRRRGLFIVIVNFGVPAGISLPGLVAAALVPTYGWPVLLLVGNLLPLAVTGLVAVCARESIKFLVQRGAAMIRFAGCWPLSAPTCPQEPYGCSRSRWRMSRAARRPDYSRAGWR